MSFDLEEYFQPLVNIVFLKLVQLGVIPVTCKQV